MRRVTSRPDWPRAAGLRLELLALLFSPLLQLFLQLLLVFLEHLRIGRRTVIGLGEFARERQRQRQRRAVGIDRLNNEVLALLHAGDQLGRCFVVGHAAVLEADDVGALQRRIAVDDDAGSVHELHAERQRHAQDLLRLAFRLDDDGGDDGLAGLDAAVLAGEADLLGAGFLALEAELGPGRVDQLDLLFRRLGGGGGSAGRRGLRGRSARREPSERPSEPPSGRPCGRFGAALGAAGRRRGLLGLRARSDQRCRQCRGRQQGENPPTRPDRRGQDTEIHCGKPFLNRSARNRYRHRHLAA